MGRVKRVIDKKTGEHPYYTEVYNKDSKEWEAQVRYYNEMQDVRDYPDSATLRNFKYLGSNEES